MVKEMSSNAVSAFRELALGAFQTPAPEFSDEEIRWEPVLRGVQNWREIEPMLLNPMDAYMLSERAFLFCLPAYMIGGLRWEFFFIDSVLKLLYMPGVPQESWNRDVWWRNCGNWNRLMSLLTADQKHVIRVWLAALGARILRRS